MKRLLCIMLAAFCLLCSLPAAAAAQTISLSASNNAETGKIVLSWSKLKDAAKYELYRSEARSGGFERMYSGSGQRTTGEKLSAGKTYYFYVKAYSSKGKLLATSGTVSRCCDLPAPKISAGNEPKSGKVTLKWQKIQGAKTYEVYRSGTRDGKYTKMLSTTKESYTNTSANTACIYYYKVKAVSKDSSYADSAFSNTVSRCCDCPRLTELRSGWTDSGAVRLSWDSVPGATHYLVCRADTEKGKYVQLTKTDSKSFTDSSAKTGYYYYYKVSAINSRRSESESSPLKITAAPAPKAPGKLRISKEKTGEYRLSWDKQSGAAGYIVFTGKGSKPEGMEIYKNVSGNVGSVSIAAEKRSNYCYVCAYCTLSNGNAVLSRPSELLRIG